MKVKRLPWLVAGAVVLALAAWMVARFEPQLPNPLGIELELSADRPGAADPLVVSGRTGEADFLFLRRIDAHTAVIGYDSWGAGGPLSRPFPLEPGVRHRLQIEMPALDQMRSRAPFNESDRLRVRVDDTVVLDEKIRHYLRDPAEIWIGENPVGGSSCAPRFSGSLLRDGRPWRGGIADLFPLRERAVARLAACGWPLLGLLTLGAAIVGFWPAEKAGARLLDAVRRMQAALATHRWFAGTAAVCLGCFAWVVTGGSGRVVFPESFGAFYDFQAASLLEGRLDVPTAAIGDEAFVRAGKSYGYFGPTPALMRLPFVIFDAGFGRLSRAFLLLDYAGCLLASYLLLRTATEFVRGRGTRPAPLTTVLLLANAGLGSTLFFLGSRAYIYHEAILCGAMWALFASACALRHLLAPARRWWVASVICGVLAVHARPPAGLFALSLLGCVALALAWSDRRKPIRRHLAIAALSAAGLASFNGLSYLKFRTFDGAPLRLNLQYDARRLARIDGKNFHVANVPFHFYTYVLRPNLDFQPGFPWLTFGGDPKPKPLFPGAKIDYGERILALPYAMPALFTLATAGGALAWIVARTARQPVAAVALAIVPMALAMFAAIANAHRYTADFCPWLVTAAAFGFAALESAAGRGRALGSVVLAATTLWAIALTAALTLHYQGNVVWGEPDDVKQNYQRLRERVDAFVGSRQHR
jgi:hypothetical protein